MVVLGEGREELLRDPAFVLERWRVPACGAVVVDAPSALTVVEGEVRVDQEVLVRGQSAVVLPGRFVLAGGGTVLVGRAVQ
jgi:hypothetical protein